MSEYNFTIRLRDLASNGLMRMALATERATTPFTNLQRRIESATGISRNSIDSLRQRLNLLHSQRNSSTSIQQIMRLNTSIRQTEQSLRRLENLPPASFGQRLIGLGGAFGGIISQAKGLISVMALIAGGQYLLNLGIQTEQSRLKFETLLGSASAAKDMLLEINQFADATPFDNIGLEKSANTLLAFGVNSQKTIPTLKMLGDIAGGSQERLDSLTLAFAQMTSAGKLQGQDLLQMVNAGFNPLQVIAEKTGIKMGVLRDAMEDGQISSELIEKAFKSATSEGGKFAGMMDKLSQSAGGKLSTLLGGTASSLGKWAEKNLNPILIQVLDFAQGFINGFDPIKQALYHLWNAVQPLFIPLGKLIESFVSFSGVGGGVGGIIQGLASVLNTLAIPLEIVASGIAVVLEFLTFMMPALRPLIILYGIFTALQWALNIAMTANPIGIIIALIVALAGGIVYAWNKFEKFRGVVMGTCEVLKTFGEVIKNYVINRFQELLNGIQGIGEALMAFFEGDFKKAMDLGSKAATNLMGVNSGKKAIDEALVAGKNIGSNFNKGYEDGVKNGKIKFDLGGSLTPKMAKKPKLAKDDTDWSSISFGGAGGKAKKEGKKGSGKDGSNNSKIESITGGGSKQNHITINLQKLNEKIEIHTTNLQNGSDQVEKQMQEMLLRVLNSANQMQTN